MSGISAYIICATPRSGSTLLCDLLAETGAAGRPNSFYRQEDILEWAEGWGITPDGFDDAAGFSRAYHEAMLREGAGDTGMFGLRLMWGSVAYASRELDRLHPGLADFPERFEHAFGPTRYIHLSRQDKVGQAVSRVRAEQSGLWHMGADGTERERVSPPGAASYDAGRIGQLISELEADDAAWDGFFAGHRIEPLRLVYETLSAAPLEALGKALAFLGRDPALASRAQVRTARLADATSREWAERFRVEAGGKR